MSLPGCELIGPRSYVVARLLGEDVCIDEFLNCDDEWVIYWPNAPLAEWPELWVDKVHDFVWVDDDGSDVPCD